jgi:hypothetical protein
MVVDESTRAWTFALARIRIPRESGSFVLVICAWLFEQDDFNHSLTLTYWWFHVGALIVLVVCTVGTGLAGNRERCDASQLPSTHVATV